MIQTALMAVLVHTVLCLAGCGGEQADLPEASAGRRVLENVLAVVEEYHYSSHLDDSNWSDLVARCRSRVESSGSVDEAISHVDELLQELGDSHCGVGHLRDIQQATSPLVYGSGTVGVDVRVIGGEVIVTRVEPGTPAYLFGISPGHRLETIDREDVQAIIERTNYRPPHNPANRRFHETEALLWRLYGEPGSRVQVSGTDPGGVRFEADLERVERGRGVVLHPSMPAVHIGLVQSRLPDGIDYVRFGAFQPSGLDNVLSAIDQLEPHGRLILDLRGNNGGSVDATLALLSRFVPETVVAFERCARTDTVVFPVGPSDHRYNGELVVMVDELSVSAAENFAAIMQNEGLAPIVGHRTPGQLLWGQGFAVGDSVMAVIPVATIRHPGSPLVEGQGIKPDVDVEMEIDDLRQGVDTQLQAAIGILKKRDEGARAE